MHAHEGRLQPAGNQLELWAEPGAPPMLGLRVLRDDGRETAFDLDNLSDSIHRAGWPGEALDADTALSLAQAVRLFLHQLPQPVALDAVREAVERVLLEMGYTLTARMYAGAFAQPADVTARGTGSAGMLDEALPIDRAERFLAGAAADAGLDRTTADALLVDLLAQIRAAGLQRLTTGLLREWMRSELHARGLAEHAARIARLSLPLTALHDAFTENDRPPVAAPADPETAALALAGRVSAAYVLGQLLPSAAGQAHLRGDIQVRGMGNFLRLDSAVLDLEPLKNHGHFTLGGRAATAERLMASVGSHVELLSRFFGGQLAWPAVNFAFAPYLDQKADDEITALAHALLTEGADVRDFVSGRATAQFGMAWDAPEHMTEFEDAEGERVAIDALYPMARVLFVAALTALAETSQHGGPTSSSSTAIHLSPYFFGARESDYLLDLIGHIATGRLPIVLHYDCPTPHLFEGASTSTDQHAVAQTVTLAVARAARASADLGEFVARLDTQLDAAVAAHRAKRDFLIRVFGERNGPLSALRARYGDGALADPAKMQYRIALEGASVAALERAGVSWIAPGEAIGAAEVVLQHLRAGCDHWRGAAGLHLTLADADSIRPLGRSLDRAVPRHVARPLDALALEARVHALYDEPPAFTISGESFATSADAAEFVRRAFLHTPCRALRFV